MTARRKHNFTLPEIERLVELVEKDYNILSLKGRLYSVFHTFQDPRLDGDATTRQS